MAHYIAMSGSAGCIPDWTCLCDSAGEARAAAADMWADELDAAGRYNLRRSGYASLPEGSGADYVEIVECGCEDPSVHEEI